ncbi:hypothetical protein ACFJI1_03275 [Pseudoxanthomonas sp. UC29_72]
MNSTFQSRIALLVSDDPRISVGRFTYGNPMLKVWAEDESIAIGAFCSIADEVIIFGGGEHRSDSGDHVSPADRLWGSARQARRSSS